jgi:signal transduction histidine kinase
VYHRLRYSRASLLVSSRIPRASIILVLVWLAVTPVAGALQSISRVREMGRAVPGTRVTVRGVVTRFRSGRSVYLQDQTGSIFAHTVGTDPLTPGDIVELTGTVEVEQQMPTIDAATYRKLGTGPAPKPIVVPVSDLVEGRHDAELVAVDGTLIRVDFTRLEDEFIVSADGVEFPSWVLRDAVGGARTIRPGSLVRVTGTAAIRSEGDRPKSFELLMRSGGDVAVLQPASWWTRTRVATVAVTLGGAVALLLSYVLLLRRQVERQTATIRDTLRAESELKEQYRQAQKMEAVGRLAGGIAHDFNNIMTVVLGHSEILALELKDHPEMRISVAEIQHAAERAAALTRQLLAFGRRQKLEPAPVDLNAVARDMVALLARVLGGDIEVRAETAAGPVMVATDRAQLEQALLNLAVNARDAMPDGGRLLLSVAQRPGHDGHVVGVVRVTDTGTGIAPDARPHIFDPFFTTKEIGRGSGLGLAMVYGFVQQSGGAIELESTVGVGTTFALTFPLAAAGSGAC